MEIYGHKIGYSLDREIAQFVRWYKKYIIKSGICCSKYYEDTTNLLSVIELVANWYEGINKHVNFNSINYNSFNAMVMKLNIKQKKIFEKPKYRSKIVFDTDLIKYDFENHKKINEYIELTNDGDIINTNISNGKFLIGSLEEKCNDFSQSQQIEINAELNRIKLKMDTIELLLNAIMYRIIEKDKVYGASRALKFAIEFNLDMDIPLVYGINLNNPNTLDLINNYLNVGGNKYLNCLLNYSTRKNNFEILKVACLSEIKVYLEEKYDIEKENTIERKVINFKK